jgi:hypothetical protein
MPAIRGADKLGDLVSRHTAFASSNWKSMTTNSFPQSRGIRRAPLASCYTHRLEILLQAPGLDWCWHFCGGFVNEIAAAVHMKARRYACVRRAVWKSESAVESRSEWHQSRRATIRHLDLPWTWSKCWLLGMQQRACEMACAHSD